MGEKKVLNCKAILPKCRQSGILSRDSQHSTTTTKYLSSAKAPQPQLTPVHGSGTATASQHPALLLFPFSSSAIPNHSSTRWLGSGEQAEPAGRSLRPPVKNCS